MYIHAYIHMYVYIYMYVCKYMHACSMIPIARINEPQGIQSKHKLSMIIYKCCVSVAGVYMLHASKNPRI